MSVGIRVDLPSNITRTTICVDSIRDGELYGRCYNPYHRVDPPGFVGLAAMIARMERLFDGFSYPQRTLEPRHFRVRAVRRRIPDKEEGEGAMEATKQSEIPRGERATFVVSVQYRQNATWQGTVSWSEQKETRHFRSMLELIGLMNDALVEDDSLANWADKENSEGDGRK